MSPDDLQNDAIQARVAEMLEAIEAQQPGFSREEAVAVVAVALAARIAELEVRVRELEAFVVP